MHTVTDIREVAFEAAKRALEEVLPTTGQVALPAGYTVYLPKGTQLATGDGSEYILQEGAAVAIGQDALGELPLFTEASLVILTNFAFERGQQSITRPSAPTSKRQARRRMGKQ